MKFAVHFHCEFKPIYVLFEVLLYQYYYIYLCVCDIQRTQVSDQCGIQFHFFYNLNTIQVQLK